MNKLNDCSVIIICVPTPLKDGLPDLTYLMKSTELILENVKNPSLIIVESTVAPGTTKIISERIRNVMDTTFWMGFSSERINPGNSSTEEIRKITKVTSGIDKEM